MGAGDRQNDTALTVRQAAVLEYIVSHVEQHGYQPSYREMAKHFGWSGPNSVVCHLKAMQRTGWVETGAARAIRLKGIRFRREQA